MNMYYCSDGSRISEATIKSRLSKAYREKYWQGHPMCEGCGERAIETSHIIGKARCKELRKTELIWDHGNMMPSCRSCHMKWEAINNPEWCELYNVVRLLLIVEKHDLITYTKRMQIYEEFR